MESLKYFLVLLGIGGLGLAGYSLYSARTYQEPGLIIDRPIFEGGQVRQGDVLDVEFRLTNNYAGPLELLSAQSSCGCSKPELTKKILAPGEIGLLKSKWHTRGMRGASETMFNLRYQPPGEGIHEVTLIAKSSVIPTVRVSPSPVRLSTAQDEKIIVRLEDASGT